VAALAGMTPSGEASLVSMAAVMAGAVVLSSAAFVWTVRSKVR
jgi:DHA1 family bicyclomycin/chloramphenicol resistance-like MFS transporter